MELKLIMLSEISDSERKIFYGFPHADCRFVSVSVCVCVLWCGSVEVESTLWERKKLTEGCK